MKNRVQLLEEIDDLLHLYDNRFHPKFAGCLKSIRDFLNDEGNRPTFAVENLTDREKHDIVNSIENRLGESDAG